MDKQNKDLLKWALENSALSNNEMQECGTSKVVNSETLEQKIRFFQSAMGPSDADNMRISVACIADSEATKENLDIALDNLEMLVESIDNAKDMEKMGLWTPLMEKLQYEQNVTSDLTAHIQEGILWVIGTAAQNNPIVQQLMVSKYDMLPKLLTLLSKSNHFAVRKKSLYCISSICTEFKKGIEKLEEFNGLNLLRKVAAEEVGLADRIQYMLDSFQH